MSTPSASNSKPTREIKVVILGDGGVGKSALVMQFVCHKFLEYHDPTIEDAYTHQVRIDGDSARLDILDTAGQPEFTAMREQYMRKGEGFIICYSITDRRSFEEVVTYKKLIDRVRNRDDIPILIVGNKCDLEEMRKVPSEDGLSLAREFGCPFFETSAPYRQCVDDIFHGIVREIRRKEQEQSTVADKRSRKQNRMKRFRNFFKGLHVFRGSRSHLDS